MPNSSMKVRSNNLSDVAYDEKTHTLSVTFHNGSQYVYRDVPPGVYERLLTADSAGRYFAAYIKPHFSGSRVA